MKNILNREIPEFVEGYGNVKPFQGATANMENINKRTVHIKAANTGQCKMIKDIGEILEKCEIKDGSVISFHHHLRNGDYVLNMVLEEVERLGLRDITVAASSIFPVHSPLVKHMENGTVTGIYANYISGPVADAISQGKLKNVAIMHTHGGRSRAIECGDLAN